MLGRLYMYMYMQIIVCSVRVAGERATYSVNVILSICNFIFTHFDLEDMILVLIVLVPGHCLRLFYFSWGVGIRIYIYFL